MANLKLLSCSPPRNSPIASFPLKYLLCFIINRCNRIRTSTKYWCDAPIIGFKMENRKDLNKSISYYCHLTHGFQAKKKQSVCQFHLHKWPWHTVYQSCLWFLQLTTSGHIHFILYYIMNDTHFAMGNVQDTLMMRLVCLQMTQPHTHSTKHIHVWTQIKYLAHTNTHAVIYKHTPHTGCLQRSKPQVL